MVLHHRTQDLNQIPGHSVLAEGRMDLPQSHFHLQSRSPLPKSHLEPLQYYRQPLHICTHSLILSNFDRYLIAVSLSTEALVQWLQLLGACGNHVGTALSALDVRTGLLYGVGGHINVPIAYKELTLPMYVCSAC